MCFRLADHRLEVDCVNRLTQLLVLLVQGHALLVSIVVFAIAVFTVTFGFCSLVIDCMTITSSYSSTTHFFSLSFSTYFYFILFFFCVLNLRKLSIC